MVCFPHNDRGLICSQGKTATDGDRSTIDIPHYRLPMAITDNCRQSQIDSIKINSVKSYNLLLEAASNKMG